MLGFWLAAASPATALTLHATDDSSTTLNQPGTNFGSNTSVLAGAVLTALATSAAATESHGDWLAFMSKDATAAYAVTTNDSGHMLGAFCSSGGAPCEWRISIPLACEADAEYQALASAPHGTAHLTLRCLGPLKSGNYRYGFTDDKETYEIVTGGEKRRSASLGSSSRSRTANFGCSGSR